MQIELNGESATLDEGATLEDAVRATGARPEHVASMLNGVVVPREERSDRALAERDVVELVTFAGGGAEDTFVLGDTVLPSRLILGTGKFDSVARMVAAVRASGTGMVTVALRRFNRERAEDDLFGPLAELEGVRVLPNTSGARDAAEAVRAAHLGRELSGSPFVKLEIHPNPHHLLPDPIETLAAAAQLVKDGFTVLPYMPADPVLAKRLEDCGCAAVMPLGAAIGSGHGLATADMLRIIVRESGVPVIVDAGLRAPSEAMAAMEMGCDAVLVNSAVANAGDPEAMARAFASAVEAGRMAHHARIMATRRSAEASSPLTAFLGPPDHA